MCPSLLVLVLLCWWVCVTCPVISAVNTTTSPTPSTPTPTSRYNPFLSSPGADISFVTLNATHPSHVAEINSIIPFSSIVYVRVDVVRSSSPSPSPSPSPAPGSSSPMNVQLNLMNEDGTGTAQSWLGTQLSPTSWYVVIRPGLTGQACAASVHPFSVPRPRPRRVTVMSASLSSSLSGQLSHDMSMSMPRRKSVQPRAASTRCDFTIQITATTKQTHNIKLTAVHVLPRLPGSQLPASITFPNVGVYGVELSPSSLTAGLPLSLRAISLSSPRPLDLWVAHETQVDSPLYESQAPKTVLSESFVLNSTSAPPMSPSLSPSSSTSLFLVAVVPTVDDTSTRSFVLTVGGTATGIVTETGTGTGAGAGPPTDTPLPRAGSQVMGTPTSYVISFVILAVIAMIGFCCFALYLLAKRRRERLMGINQAVAADTMGVFTSGRVVEQQPPPPGVTTQELELIPVHTDIPKAGSEEALCSVCLSGYDSCHSVRTLACGHYFHVSCIDPWLQQHRTCPYCRVDAIPNINKAGATPSATPRGAVSSRARVSAVHSPAVASLSPSLESSPSHSQSPYYVEQDSEDRDRHA